MTGTLLEGLGDALVALAAKIAMDGVREVIRG